MISLGHARGQPDPRPAHSTPRSHAPSSIRRRAAASCGWIHSSGSRSRPRKRSRCENDELRNECAGGEIQASDSGGSCPAGALPFSHSSPLAPRSSPRSSAACTSAADRNRPAPSARCRTRTVPLGRGEIALGERQIRLGQVEAHESLLQQRLPRNRRVERMPAAHPHKIAQNRLVVLVKAAVRVAHRLRQPAEKSRCWAAPPPTGGIAGRFSAM